MNNYGVAAFALFCVAIGVNAVDSSDDKFTEQALANAKLLTSGITNFTIELLYHTSNHVGSHLVVSPFSVWSILAIIAEGASGDTFNELQTKLRLPNEKSIRRTAFEVLERLFNHNTSSVELETLNTLFRDLHVPFKPEYEGVIERWYKANIIPIDFYQPTKTAHFINNYISRATKGKITTLLKEDDLREPQMIMSNVIYFRGQWSIPFNKSETKKEPFYDGDGKQIGEVNMMYQRAAYPFANIKDFEANFVELPYGHDNKYSLLVILPRKKVPLQKLFLHLANEPIKKMFDKLEEAAEEREGVEADIYIPRFQIDSDMTLNEALNDVGIFDVFDSKYANLEGISPRQIYLSRIVHKAVIEVTEEGTVAAAVTGGELLDRTQPAVFKANRPFVYFVIEKSTNVIMFGGIYSKPSLF